MTETTLAVVPPAVPGLPALSWGMAIGGQDVVPGAATVVPPGPVTVTLRVQARTPGTRVEATLELTVDVYAGGPTTVVVRPPLPPLLSTRGREVG